MDETIKFKLHVSHNLSIAWKNPHFVGSVDDLGFKNSYRLNICTNCFDVSDLLVVTELNSLLPKHFTHEPFWVSLCKIRVLYTIWLANEKQEEQQSCHIYYTLP
jgi:hypothetical protein